MILLFASLFTNLVGPPKAALAGLLVVIGAQLVKLAINCEAAHENKIKIAVPSCHLSANTYSEE